MSSMEETAQREEVSFGKAALSDVTIAVGNKDFKVHKYALALVSDYFEALFFGNFKEKDQDRIKLDADPLAFHRLLTFIYDRNFGDETFLKCPSKLDDPTKGFGIDCYTLYEHLGRFDVKKARAHFWTAGNREQCKAMKKGKGVIASDCGHCINRPLIAATYNGKPGNRIFTSRAVKAWMEKYYASVPHLVYSTPRALPKVIKEMAI